MVRCLLTLAILCHAAALNAQTSWRDSLAVLNRQIALSPRSTDLRLKKAAVNIELGQWEYAADEYGRVLDIDPQCVAALYFRAYVHRHLRQLDLAQRDYEHCLAIVPRHFEARFGLAMVIRQMGRQQETMDQLNLLVQQHPDSAMAFAARADYETELRQYETALYDWDEALRRDGGNAAYVAAKTELLLGLKRNDEAWATLEEGMRHGIPRAALKEWIDRCK